MTNTFLTKIKIQNTEQLIFTDGKKFAPVKSLFPNIHSFTDFLSLINPDNLSVDFKSILPEDVSFLDLIDDQHIFATGCTFEWTPEKIANTPDQDVYKKIYLSERSMFFYKGSKNNLAKRQGPIGLRPDSSLTIPEAEIVVLFNNEGKIIGHTIGNDVTAVDIEKENPLFQMQAKFYKGSVALLPLIKLGSAIPETNVNCRVFRNNKCIVETSYNTKSFNRSSQTIVNQLLKLGLTQSGGFLFLGCGASYPKDKGLLPNDTVILQADFLPMVLQNTCDFI